MTNIDLSEDARMDRKDKADALRQAKIDQAFEDIQNDVGEVERIIEFNADVLANAYVEEGTALGRSIAILDELEKCLLWEAEKQVDNEENRG